MWLRKPTKLDFSCDYSISTNAKIVTLVLYCNTSVVFMTISEMVKAFLKEQKKNGSEKTAVFTVEAMTFMWEILE
jgi:hypothetical protein